MGALAARCSACGTVFRVVQDQLRVAGGLVRCGRCGEVFNAAESLIDLESGGTGASTTPPSEAADPPTLPSRSAAVALTGGTDFDLQLESPPVEPARRAGPPGASDVSAGESLHTAPAAADPDQAAQAPVPPPAPADLPGLHADESDRIRFSPQAQPALAEAPLDGPVAIDSALPQAPSFLRRAERAQRWRQPRVRAALAAGCVLGLLLLAAQAAYTWRDQLAAAEPELRGPLLALCGTLRCQIEPVRSIDSLAVDNSGLVRVEKSDLYRLQVTLRNRSSGPVAVPALELTLNDNTGKALARRVLRPVDLGVTEATLAAGRGLPLQATLQTRFPGPESVSGYTIELFYP